MPVTSYSRTPASNNAAPPNGWPEGQAPSTVNDCARQLMTDVVNEATKGQARLLSGVAGTNTITATMTPDLDAYAAGMVVIFTPANTNTGATTLNIDSLGALDIQKGAGSALVAGDLVAGIPALLVLDSGADDWILVNLPYTDFARLSVEPVFTAAGSSTSGTVRLSSTIPILRFNDTDASADNRVWDFQASQGTFNGTARNDAGSLGADWLTVLGNGSGITSINLAATAVTLTGNVTHTAADFQTSVISPAALPSGDTNDYAPAGFAAARIIRIDPNSAGSTITGIAGGAAGRVVTLVNIATSNYLVTLAAESSSSAAANRFGMLSGFTISPGIAARIWYDVTSSRWRVGGG